MEEPCHRPVLVCWFSVLVPRLQVACFVFVQLPYSFMYRHLCTSVYIVLLQRHVCHAYIYILYSAMWLMACLCLFSSLSRVSSQEFRVCVLRGLVLISAAVLPCFSLSVQCYVALFFLSYTICSWCRINSGMDLAKITHVIDLCYFAG